MGMTRVNVYGNECVTGNGDEGDASWDRVRKLTTVLVRAGGEYDPKKKKRKRIRLWRILNNDLRNLNLS